jgi:hypothetical protein
MRTFTNRMAMAIAAAFMLLAAHAGSSGNPPAGAEYAIHTLYIFNFTKYVEWPTAPNKMRIGVVDNASAEEQLQKMAKAKSTSGTEISVVNSRNDSDLSTCQIIFIPSNSSAMAARLIERFGDKPILIVTEESNLVKKGASISFKVNDGKLRFQVNEEAINAKGMKVSTTLTSLAEK